MIRQDNQIWLPETQEWYCISCGKYYYDDEEHICKGDKDDRD